MKLALHGLITFLVATVLASGACATQTNVELCRREMQGVIAQCKQGSQCSDKCLTMQKALHACRVARHEESNMLSPVATSCNAKTTAPK